MDASDINKLLMKVAGDVGTVPDDVRNVFSTLISITLRYRDLLKYDLGIVLSVEDVHVALGWLLESIRTKKLPETDNALRLDLLKLWLDELKPHL